MNSLTEQAAQVLAEIDEQLAICEKATAGPNGHIRDRRGTQSNRSAERQNCGDGR